MTIFTGPNPQEHTARQAIINRIVADLQKSYGDQLIAIGLYGSMSRGSDLPYSDVELCCVVQGEGIDETKEWVYHPSKAEVNIQSPDCYETDLLDVDEAWAIWKGSFLDMTPIYGDDRFFDERRKLVHAPADGEFNNAIAGMIVGELYEWMGKLRNARHVGDDTILPQLAFKFVEHCALMLGLAHRHCYTTGSSMVKESLQLPNRPDGYDGLCALVQSGRLADEDEVAAQTERLWVGMEAWTEEMGIEFDGWVGWPF